METPVYLDYMASTPMDPAVLTSMVDCLQSQECMGNPSSNMHVYGRAAAAKVEESRRQVAELIHAEPKQIVFTSGGTEAINMAIKGVAFYYQRQGKHLITAQTEHKAVLNTCEYLSSLGFEVTYLRVNKNGLIDLDELKSSVRPDTILVSLMHVNNETGVIQDINALGSFLRSKGIIFHVDAVQSVGKLAVDVRHLPVDLMSFSAHKNYGPKGIGALYISHKPKINLVPLIQGGGQEHGLRSGTIATHQVVGMAAAFKLAGERLQLDQKNAAELNAFLWQSLSQIQGVHLQGEGAPRVATCLNVRFDGVIARDLLVKLQDQIAASPGSACSSTQIGPPSHVLIAMGLSELEAEQAVRLSFGRYTTKEELAFAVKAIHEAVIDVRNRAN